MNNGLRVFLAALTLFVKMLVPPGFMPAGPDTVAWVICTGEGPITVGDGHFPSQQPHDQSRHAEHPCAFNAHAATPPPTWITGHSRSRIDYIAQVETRPSHIQPGRGLAAPPPPAQAPPFVTS